jgi:hypothetical protein
MAKKQVIDDKRKQLRDRKAVSMTPCMRLNCLISYMANSVYRPWFWLNYRKSDQQVMFRQDWYAVASRYTWQEIKAGIQAWEREHGVDCPPDPAAFYDFAANAKNHFADHYLAEAKRILGYHDVVR